MNKPHISGEMSKNSKIFPGGKKREKQYLKKVPSSVLDNFILFVCANKFVTFFVRDNVTVPIELKFRIIVF